MPSGNMVVTWAAGPQRWRFISLGRESWWPSRCATGGYELDEAIAG